MNNFWKKTVLIFGHAVCLFILIYCYAKSNISVFDLSISPANGSVTPTEVPVVIPTEVIQASLAPTEAVQISVTPTEVPQLSVTPTEPPANTPVLTETVEISPTVLPEFTEIQAVSDREELKKQVWQRISDGIYAGMDNKNDEWWFSRKKNHVVSGSGEFFDISEYQGFYLDKSATEEDKVIYLTLDCGYGSSNTKVILDVLKKHDVKATFFVTKMFMDAEPESVRRMVEEGHTVGNHTVSHRDLPELTEEEIYQEIILCEERFYEITGTQMPLFFRPPGGAYSKRTMQITEDLGYKTIFWSIAYYDYNLNDQPGKQYVIDHFEEYHHNGAIPLMHNDSSSNRDAMDAVITFLKEEGYRFGSLEDLILETE